MNRIFGTNKMAFFTLVLIPFGTAAVATSCFLPATNTTETHFQLLDEAYLSEESARRRFRDRDDKPKEYKESEAPPLTPAPPQTEKGEDFEFAKPVGPAPSEPITPPPVSPPESSNPKEAENPISEIIGSLTRLLDGEGGFSDIVRLAITVFSLFGGSQFLASDMLFKTILSLFSGKKNFDDILSERVSRSSRSTRRSRRRRK